MKFHEVLIGQRFEFEGEDYTKKSPVTATHGVSGRQKFIRRSAPVKPVSEELSPISRSGTCLDADIVAAALDVFHSRCLECLGDLAPEVSEASIANAREKLARGRAEFESALPPRIRSRDAARS